MSTSHTRRRKLIARLKRQHGRKWLPKFQEECTAARKRLEGQYLGTLQDALDATSLL